MSTAPAAFDARGHAEWTMDRVGGFDSPLSSLRPVRFDQKGLSSAFGAYGSHEDEPERLDTDTTQ